jgi:DNA-binding transcriptional LysR family regulator
VELRHLRYLVAVADASTFSAAAQQLGIAQPALTRQVRELERELGAELFETGARRATLTPAGSAAVRVARQVIDEIRRAVQRARLTQRGLAGRCVLGVSRGPTMEGLPARLIQLARTRCPDVSIELVEAEFGPLWEMLTKGELDVGLGQPAPNGYATLSTETQQHRVADGALLDLNNPLAQRATLRLADLHGAPFVWIGPENLDHLFTLGRRQLLRQGFPETDMRMAPSTEALALMIAAHHGWSLMPRSLASALPPGFTLVPVEDVAVAVRYGRIWRRADHRPVTQTVLELLRHIEREDNDEQHHRTPKKRPDDVTFVPARLELRHLRYFTRVVDAGSFGRAAEELSLTQPALSRQMRDLEYDVGVQLLERETRGVRLTLAGEALHEDARRLLAISEDMVATIRRAERGSAGRCIVGVIPLPAVRALVTTTVRRCEARDDSVEIVIKELPSARMPDALRNSVVDIGLVQGPQPAPDLDDLKRRHLMTDPVDTALVSSSHPLANRGVVHLAELRETPMLFFPREVSPHLYDTVMEAFAVRAFSPMMDLKYETLNTMWAMVAAGLGWCFATHSQRDTPQPGTKALCLLDLEIPWGVDLLYRSDEARKVVLTVIQTLQANVTTFGVSVPSLQPPSATSKASIS